MSGMQTPMSSLVRAIAAVIVELQNELFLTTTLSISR
jgi:hypothetical protein